VCVPFVMNPHRYKR